MNEKLEWRCIDSEPISAGDVGGDGQVTEAWSVRWEPVSQPDDGLYALVTQTWYGETFTTTEDGEPDLTDVGLTERTEYMVCRNPKDPGSSEVWSDYADEPASALSFTLENAEREVRAIADQMTKSNLPHLEWDGRTVTVGGMLQQ